MWDAYNNYRTKLAAARVIERRSKSRSPQPKRRKSGSTVCTVDSDLFALDEEGNETNDLEQLKAVTSPFDVVECKWRSTVYLREQMLKTEISTVEYIDRYFSSLSSRWF